jgi:carbonic anhydrase
MPQRSMPEELAEGFGRFRADSFQRQRALFEELAAKGQKPHSLVIACCDSRVTPGQVFDAKPGELFVVRNVANIVPPFIDDHLPHGLSAAMEFAVTALEVPNILVLGHRQCGGVKTCVSGGAPAETLFLNDWLEPLEGAVAEARADLPGEEDVDILSERTELCAIRASIERLKGYPFIADRLKSEAIQLHGARFSIADGALEWLTVDGEFAPVVEGAAVRA